MARTALTPTLLARDGSTVDPGGTAIASVQAGGAYVADPPGPDRVYLRVTNTFAGSKNVTVRAGGNGVTVTGGANPGVPFDSASVGDLVVAIAQNANVTIGPLTSDRFCQADGSLSVDFDSAMTGTVWVFRLPPARIDG